MKNRHDIMRAINEILERRDEADLHRLTALCWVLDPDVDWTTAQERAQLLLGEWTVPVGEGQTMHPDEEVAGGDTLDYDSPYQQPSTPTPTESDP